MTGAILTRRPERTSARTTVATSAAKAGNTSTSIEQKRMRVFWLGPSFNANIRAVERAGWVLTGGASSRMGFNKALVEIDGRPLVLVVAEAMAKVCGVVSLVGDPARYGGLGLPVVADHFPG